MPRYTLLRNFQTVDHRRGYCVNKIRLGFTSIIVYIVYNSLAHKYSSARKVWYLNGDVIFKSKH